MGLLGNPSDASSRQVGQRVLDAVDVADFGYWEFDAKTREVYLSDGACALFGLPRGTQGGFELLGTLVSEKELQKVHASTESCLKTGKDYHVFFKIRRKDDGALRWVESRGKREVDGQTGEPLLLYGTFQDITTTMVAQRRLEDTQGVLRLVRNLQQHLLRLHERGEFLQKICQEVTLLEKVKSVWIISKIGDEKLQWASYGIDKKLHEMMQAKLEEGKLPACYEKEFKTFIEYKKDSTQCSGCVLKLETSDDVNFSVGLWYEGEHYGMMGVVLHPGEEENAYIRELFFWLGKDIAFVLKRVAFVEKVKALEKLHTSMFNSALSGAFIHDLDGQLIDINPALERLHEAPKEEILKHNVANFYLKAHEAIAKKHFETLMKEGHIYVKTPLRTVKGKEFYAEIYSSLIDIDGKKFVQGMLHDITDSYEAEKKMHQHEAISLSTQEGICITDAAVQITYVNESFSAITGYALEELKGCNPSVLKSGRHDKAFYKSMWENLKSKGVWQGEIWNRRKTGEIYPEFMTIRKIEDAIGRVEGYVAVFSDLSVKKRNERKINFLGTHDPLTKLPNRQSTEEKLNHLIGNTSFEGSCIVVMSIDIDAFKNINDSFGHSFGDQLLIALVKRVQSLVGHRTAMGRLSADEFVLFEKVDSFEESVHRVKTLLDELQKPFEIDDKQISITVSIGASLAPVDGKDAGILIRNADTARYKVKQEGKNNYTFFKDEMTRLSYERVLMINALREAISKEDFTLFYQPLQALDTGKIVGVEALLRWESKDFGAVSPLKFIPLAEETKLIVPLGEWVIKKVCQQLALWKNNEAKKELTIAINVSGVQLYHGDLVAMLQEHLNHFKVDARLLKLEITESTIMSAPEKIVSTLEKIKSMGIALSIDDFGTGYSSLARLKKLPIDVLKVDRSFTVDIPQDQDACALARSILSIAKQMSLGIIVEGVETKEQRAFYEKEKGCILQGYFLAKPMSAEALEEWLKNHV